MKRADELSRRLREQLDTDERNFIKRLRESVKAVRASKGNKPRGGRDEK